MISPNPTGSDHLERSCVQNSDSVEASGVVASGPGARCHSGGCTKNIRILPLLAGKRVGVVVNQTSMIGNTLLPEALQGAGFEVTAIFAPEHGFRGEQEAGESVSNGKTRKQAFRSFRSMENARSLPLQI